MTRGPSVFFSWKNKTISDIKLVDTIIIRRPANRLTQYRPVLLFYTPWGVGGTENQHRAVMG